MPSRSACGRRGGATSDAVANARANGLASVDLDPSAAANALKSAVVSNEIKIPEAVASPLHAAVPLGFHCLRTLSHASRSLQTVLHCPRPGCPTCFIARDGSSLHLWHRATRAARIPVSTERRNICAQSSASPSARPPNATTVSIAQDLPPIQTSTAPTAPTPPTPPPHFSVPPALLNAALDSSFNRKKEKEAQNTIPLLSTAHLLVSSRRRKKRPKHALNQTFVTNNNKQCSAGVNAATKDSVAGEVTKDDEKEKSKKDDDEDEDEEIFDEDADDDTSTVSATESEEYEEEFDLERNIHISDAPSTSSSNFADLPLPDVDIKNLSAARVVAALPTWTSVPPIIRKTRETHKVQTQMRHTMVLKSLISPDKNNSDDQDKDIEPSAPIASSKVASAEPKKVATTNANSSFSVPTRMVQGRTSALATCIPAFDHAAFLPDLSLLVLSSDTLELITVDSLLHVTSVLSCSQPILTLDVDPVNHRIIAGCVSCISILQVARFTRSGCVEARPVYGLLRHPVHYICDFKPHEWVCCTALFGPHSMKPLLYVACDCNLYIYDYITATRIDTLASIHELAISCLAVHERTGLFATGSKDGFVKVWNRQHLLVASYSEFATSITGLFFPPAPINYPRGPTFLLSSALSGTLRIYDVDRNNSVFSQTFPGEVLGIGLMRRQYFYYYSRNAIQILKINMIATTFSYTISPCTVISRVVQETTNYTEIIPAVLARIAVLTEDGAIRLFSPVTNAQLLVAYPTFKNSFVVDLVHDIVSESIVALLNNGDLAYYSTRFNPAKIMWVSEIQHVEIEQLTCLAFFSEPFVVFAGSQCGHIAIVDTKCCTTFSLTEANGKQTKTAPPEILVHGHQSSIKQIKAVLKSNILCSISRDGYLKAWSYDGKENKLSLLWSLHFYYEPKCFACPSFETQDPIFVGLEDDRLAVVSKTKGSAAQCGNIYTGQPRISFLYTQTPATCIIDYHPGLRLYLTAGGDDCLRLWLSSASLLRELRLSQPILSAAFANARGDILVGFSQQAVLIKAENYIPIDLSDVFQQNSLFKEIKETPLAFDENVDIWSFFRGRVGFHHEFWQIPDLKNGLAVAKMPHFFRDMAYLLSAQNPYAGQLGAAGANFGAGGRRLSLNSHKAHLEPRPSRMFRVSLSKRESFAISEHDTNSLFSKKNSMHDEELWRALEKYITTSIFAYVRRTSTAQRSPVPYSQPKFFWNITLGVDAATRDRELLEHRERKKINKLDQKVNEISRQNRNAKVMLPAIMIQEDDVSDAGTDDNISASSQEGINDSDSGSRGSKKDKFDLDKIIQQKKEMRRRESLERKVSKEYAASFNSNNLVTKQQLQQKAKQMFEKNNFSLSNKEMQLSDGVNDSSTDLLTTQIFNQAIEEKLASLKHEKANPSRETSAQKRQQRSKPSSPMRKTSPRKSIVRKSSPSNVQFADMKPTILDDIRPKLKHKKIVKKRTKRKTSPVLYESRSSYAQDKTRISSSAKRSQRSKTATFSDQESRKKKYRKQSRKKKELQDLGSQEKPAAKPPISSSQLEAMLAALKTKKEESKFNFPLIPKVPGQQNEIAKNSIANQVRKKNARDAKLNDSNAANNRISGKALHKSEWWRPELQPKGKLISRFHVLLQRVMAKTRETLTQNKLPNVVNMSFKYDSILRHKKEYYMGQRNLMPQYVSWRRAQIDILCSMNNARHQNFQDSATNDTNANKGRTAALKIINDLITVIQNRTVVTQTRVEALQALALVKHVFIDDTSDLQEFCVQRLIELSGNEEEPVIMRMSALLTVPQLSDLNATILTGLVVRAQDQDQKIRRWAIEALSLYEIYSRETLLDALEKYGLSNNSKIYVASNIKANTSSTNQVLNTKKATTKRFRSVLDDMYDEQRMQEKKDNLEAIERAGDWVHLAKYS